jgi:hypothetical protein
MAANRAQWRCAAEVAIWRNGWAWPLAAALALSAVAWYLLSVRPTRQLYEAASAELIQARAGPPAAREPEADASEEGPRRLQAIRVILQSGPEPNELLRKMASVAKHEQIALAQADYQHHVDTAIGVIRVQISQPLRATYPQLRNYLESVLTTVPSASLDQVVARRENVTQAQLEARLKWSLWIYRAPPDPAAAGGRKRGMP